MGATFGVARRIRARGAAAQLDTGPVPAIAVEVESRRRVQGDELTVAGTAAFIAAYATACAGSRARSPTMRPRFEHAMSNGETLAASVRTGFGRRAIDAPVDAPLSFEGCARRFGWCPANVPTGRCFLRSFAHSGLCSAGNAPPGEVLRSSSCAFLSSHVTWPSRRSRIAAVAFALRCA